MNLESIWSEYRTGLKAFLHSKISNEADVEDLLQDILFKTHEKSHQLRAEDSIKSWLYQIANNTITDFYRRNAREQLIAGDLWYKEPESDVKEELSVCVHPFVNALSPESAELLIAIDLQGVPQKEYAESLGISYSTLKSRVQKARKELRGLFDECCHMTMDAQGNLMEYEQRPEFRLKPQS